MLAIAKIQIKYSFVLPIYNEQETLPELRSRMLQLIDQLDGPSEVILVDDGSRDSSPELLHSIRSVDSRFKVIRFARNFGHQVAISAGIDFSQGEAVIVMDADLQDPPDIVHAMIAKWKDGFQVVYGIREQRKGESLFKRLTAALFYRVLSMLTDIKIPVDVGDFRLIDRRAVEAFKALRESNRYVRGMFTWVGFRQTGVKYQRAERFAGTTKYPLRKMMKFAIDGIVSFSNAPLKLAMTVGLVVAVGSMAFGMWAIFARLLGIYTVSGWTSLMVIICVIGGVQLTVTGLVGQYIGRIYDESKGRPLYIVADAQGFDGTVQVPQRVHWYQGRNVTL